MPGVRRIHVFQVLPIHFVCLSFCSSACHVSVTFPVEKLPILVSVPRNPGAASFEVFCEMEDAEHSPARPALPGSGEMEQNRENSLVLTGAFPLESIRIEGNK
jgi:hypothetical protein